MRPFYNGGRIFLAAMIPGGTDKYDIVSKDTKTYQSFLQEPDNETGMDRVKRIFQMDEFDSPSPEMVSMYQVGFTGFLFGAIYGGFIHSRIAYMNFMENNQATAFKSHFEAKRQLQDRYTINFAKGGLKWGWRIALFTTSYYGLITCISTYRGKSSIYEYLAAGTITGSLYKVSMGLRGMAAGGIIGGALGGVAGCISLAILKLTGTSMEDVRLWHHRWSVNRQNQIRAVYQAHAEGSEPELIKEHDKKVGATLSLENVK